MNGVEDDTFSMGYGMKHLSSIETNSGLCSLSLEVWGSMSILTKCLNNLLVLEETESWYSVSQKTVKEPQYLFISSIVVTYGPFIVEFSHAGGMQAVETVFWTPSSHILPLTFQVWMPLISLSCKSNHNVPNINISSIHTTWNASLSVQHGQIALHNPPKQDLQFSPLANTLCICSIPLNQSFIINSVLLSDPQGAVHLLVEHGSKILSTFANLFPLVGLSSFSLGSNYHWVVGCIWQCSILAVVEKAVAPATITDEEKSS